MSKQGEIRECAWQGRGLVFTPRYEGQRFHSPKCRAAYSREVGLQGTAVSITKLKGGRVSVVMHFPAEAEAKALAISKGGRYRVVREPADA